MILTRPPIWKRPAFGRLCNGTSNAITTTTLNFSSQTKIAIAWWEFSSTTTGTRCVMETGTNGFPSGSGEGIAIFRNDVAAGTMEFAYTTANASAVSRFTQPTASRWNLIMCNIDGSQSSAAAQCPAAWVNSVAQSLTTTQVNFPVAGPLTNQTVNIGSRNAGASFRNDVAYAQVAWVAGYQWTADDAKALYAGAAHPKQYLLQHGVMGFVWQPEYAGSPDRLFVKGLAAGYATHAGTTLKEFPQRLPA